MSFKLTPGTLTFNQFVSLVSSDTKITLDHTAYDAIEHSFNVVKKVVESDKTVYGINTGFGRLASEKISKGDLKELQKRIILSHACGVGRPFERDIVKGILLLKINSLALGYSGVSKTLVDALVALYNHCVYPQIPKQGSVGASGDLAPLAHMSMVLLGEGKAEVNGEIVDGKKALAIAGIKPLTLREKEGLALINGTQVSTALALVGLMRTQRNFSIATIVGMMTLDAINGSVRPFRSFIAKAKNSKGQVRFSRVAEGLLRGSEIMAAHQVDCKKVQDPYSIRCQPQVMGAIWQMINSAKDHLICEANSVSDNPLICPETSEIISGGNFHAEISGLCADNLSMSCSEIGAISERRIALMMDASLSGLPAFLVNEPGLNSGFMMAHVTASALASENKTLCYPSSVDSLPTSANQEDHVSMAPCAGRKLCSITGNVLYILAIESLAACQGLDFKKPLKSSPPLNRCYEMMRSLVPFYEKDRYFSPDIEKAVTLISDRNYYSEVEKALFD